MHPAEGAQGEGPGQVITGAQIRETRRLLGWDPDQLARKAKVPRQVILFAESTRGEAPITIERAKAIRTALEAAGIEFTNGDAPGVRLKSRGPRTADT